MTTSRPPLSWLAPAGAPFFMAVSSVSARLLLAWNAIALPALALVQVCAAPQLCSRLLESAGVEAPLAGLFQLLDGLQ